MGPGPNTYAQVALPLSQISISSCRGSRDRRCNDETCGRSSITGLSIGT